jgi:hypothetical protein
MALSAGAGPVSSRLGHGQISYRQRLTWKGGSGTAPSKKRVAAPTKLPVVAAKMPAKKAAAKKALAKKTVARRAPTRKAASRSAA